MIRDADGGIAVYRHVAIGESFLLVNGLMISYR